MKFEVEVSGDVDMFEIFSVDRVYKRLNLYFSLLWSCKWFGKEFFVFGFLVVWELGKIFGLIFEIVINSDVVLDFVFSFSYFIILWEGIVFGSKDVSG